MAASDTEIVVGDPGEPAEDSPALASSRSVERVVYVALVALALLLGYDNWKSGMGWASDGPQRGYLPFYLSLILGGAALWGLGTTFIARDNASARNLDRAFVTRAQLRRVLQVFVPTLLFVAATQWLGIYVASLLLVAGFMRFIGRIAWWKCIVTSIVFAGVMFMVFDVAFDVIMPKGPLERALGR
jgi:hypothetical protein